MIWTDQELGSGARWASPRYCILGSLYPRQGGEGGEEVGGRNIKNSGVDWKETAQYFVIKQCNACEISHARLAI